MKIEIISEKDVTDIDVRLYTLWLSVTGLKIKLIEYEYLPENENEQKCLSYRFMFGNGQHLKSIKFVTDDVVTKLPQGKYDVTDDIPKKIGEFNVTDNLSVKLRQGVTDKDMEKFPKEEINELWKILHTTKNESGGKCCICGKDDKYYLLQSGNKTTCSKHTLCPDIRSSMIYYLQKQFNKIKLSERIFICSYCNINYKPKREDSKFCSLKCRVNNFRKNKKVLS